MHGIAPASSSVSKRLKKAYATALIESIVGCVMELVGEPDALRRKERRLMIFVLVFFSVGATILFVSSAYFVVSMRSVHGDETAVTEFIEGYEPTRKVLGVLGSSLSMTAFILIPW